MGQTFAYSTDVNEVFKLLPFVKKLTDDEQQQFYQALDLLLDRDDELTSYSSGVLYGDAGSNVIACAAGGVTIDFNRTLARAPVTIVCSLGDDASGAVISVVPGDTTNSSFKVKVRDAAGVELVGGESIRVNWIATI